MKNLHSYDIETEIGIIEVIAVNRTQAATKVRAMGHEIRSVNMTG